jgi:hypothetical protein
MQVGPDWLLPAIALGAGATLLMDVWNLVVKHALRIPSLDYCLLGRWLLHMPSGIVRHVKIAGAPQKPGECVVGRVAHYGIGVAFGIVFVALAPDDWLGQPTVAPPLTFGIATVVFPLFIMQPSFGLGIASSKTPNPTRARLKSLMSHTAFGAGLYVCALGMKHLPTARG